ncbi:phage portal protein [Pseudodonghicola flavimaris]|uniref:Phage portal protein n=1 Tax=Pseudodonghicola flavimaris TaxID=3050036 RepID=A0ABT7F3U7_9RHOB|nr:phage portal protein [Pseudodonghicola flavimaris]MDK3019278.1 phage portal protein [Pseudodonghicola flavimaris]
MAFDFMRRPRKAVESGERKASAAGPMVAWQSAGRVAWSPRDVVTLTRTGYLGNPVAHRAVKMIVEAAAALPLVLQDRQRRFDSHPVLALVRRPNAGQSRAEFLEALVAQLLLSGNGYVEAVMRAEAAPGELPLELHVLRSDRIEVVPGADGWPMAYDYVLGARRHRFDLAGPVPVICHVKNFHPQDDHYGFAPLQAAAMAVDVHNSASRWSKSLLDNAARPSGALVWRGSDGLGVMAEDQFRRLSEEIEENYRGARNAGRPMVLEGGLDWKPMGFSPSDMEFQKTKEAAAREIAQAFGVPPMLLGIPGDATYANYQEANRAFYRLTVLPLAGRVVAALSDWLMRHCGETAELRPDLDQVPALAAEREAQWNRVLKADFLSEAEKRALLGLPPRVRGLSDD